MKLTGVRRLGAAVGALVIVAGVTVLATGALQTDAGAGTSANRGATVLGPGPVTVTIGIRNSKFSVKRLRVHPHTTVEFVARHMLSKSRRDRVADLRLNGRTRSHKLELIREREQSSQLGDPKTAIVPVKWAYIWTRLGLDRRGGACGALRGRSSDARLAVWFRRGPRALSR